MNSRSRTEVQRILNAVPASDVTYEEWLRIGMALKNEGESLAVWEEWSGKDSRYRPGECQQKWNSFRGSASPVKMGTIVQIAKEHGYRGHFQKEYALPDRNGIIPWNGVIADDGDIPEKGRPAGEGSVPSDSGRCGRTAPEPLPLWATENAPVQDPVQQLIRYMDTLFKPEEYVGFVTGDVFKNQSGKWCPLKGNYNHSARMILDMLRHFPDDISKTVGTWQAEAGGWIRFNPLDGSGTSDANVTAFRYALVESDTMPLAAQERILRDLELPVVFLVYSGGKSLHAIVRIDAEDAEEYRQRVDFLYSFLEKNGMPVDRANRNPSRLSRMPGLTRNGKQQCIVAENIGKNSWAEWFTFAENRINTLSGTECSPALPADDGEEDRDPVCDGLPQVETFESSMVDDPPALADELIGGVLRCGHKMLISGSSKAGKSFLLMELAIAIAEGRTWLGFPCKQGQVMYVNLEIDRSSCISRFSSIYRALGIRPKAESRLDIWNLRGKALPLDILVPKLLRRMKSRHYDAVIIDPIYKVITGDENNASDMADFCNQFDRICDAAGCAVIYCHHHSKGVQGAKRAMDRASGSGVFARDPDAQLDMIQLQLTEGLINNVRDGNATAWRLEGSLREFENFRPVNFWFDYPLHRVDEENLKDIQPQGSSSTNLGKSGKRTTEKERRYNLDTAYSVTAENGYTRVADMAEYLGVEEKTVRAYLREFKESYRLDKGVVTKILSP